MQPFIIAASVFSADLARLGEECKAVLAAGADWIHFDVMDNHYVPNLSLGPIVCQSLRKTGVKAHIDVHLMVKPVDSLITMFAKAGATSISFHPDASDNVDRSLQLIKDHGCLAGLVFNPETQFMVSPSALDKLDIVLLMSVNPGFSGQVFIPTVLDKLRTTRTFIDSHKKSIRLQVDGGISADNIEAIAKAGADTFVAGSAIFGSENYKATINNFREKLKSF